MVTAAAAAREAPHRTETSQGVSRDRVHEAVHEVIHEAVHEVIHEDTLTEEATK